MATLEELEAQIEKRVCIRCGEKPRIIWGGSFGIQDRLLRCACWQFNDDGTLKKIVEPVLGERETQKKFISRRLGRMVEQSLAKRPERMPLSIGEIKDYISPLASEQEAYVFLRFCQAQGLNPFVQEAFLVKYDKAKPAAFVVGINAYLKRAAADENYRGYDAGVIVVNKEDQVIKRDGEFLHPGDKLVGAWSITDMANRNKPLEVTVNFNEYDKGRATWKEMPATMIVKVAVVQGLRRAIPAVQEMHGATQGIEIRVDEMPEAEADTTPPVEAPVQNGNGGVTDETHPWLVSCPEHADLGDKAKWFQTKNMRSPAHKDANDKFCNQNTIIGRRAGASLGESAEVLEWDKNKLKEWLKSEYGGTWSTLSSTDHISAMEAAGALAQKKLAESAEEGIEAQDADREQAMADADQVGKDLFGQEGD